MRRLLLLFYWKYVRTIRRDEWRVKSAVQLLYYDDKQWGPKLNRPTDRIALLKVYNLVQKFPYLLRDVQGLKNWNSYDFHPL